jgi:hypothetical protein
VGLSWESGSSRLGFFSFSTTNSTTVLSINQRVYRSIFQRYVTCLTLVDDLTDSMRKPSSFPSRPSPISFKYTAHDQCNCPVCIDSAISNNYDLLMQNDFDISHHIRHYRLCTINCVHFSTTAASSIPAHSLQHGNRNHMVVKAGRTSNPARRYGEFPFNLPCRVHTYSFLAHSSPPRLQISPNVGVNAVLHSGVVGMFP